MGRTVCFDPGTAMIPVVNAISPRDMVLMEYSKVMAELAERTPWLGVVARMAFVILSSSCSFTSNSPRTGDVFSNVQGREYADRIKHVPKSKILSSTFICAQQCIILMFPVCY